MDKTIKLIDTISKNILLYFWIFIMIALLTGSTYINTKEGNTAHVFHPMPEEEPEPEPQKDWRDNIRPEPENKIVLTWAYKPQKFQEKPPGVNVLAPIWFYVEDVNSDGIPRLMDIIELGRPADFEGYVNTAHEEGGQVWGTVVSFNPLLTDKLIHNSEYKQAFIEKMALYIQDLNLDGINFDFENMNPKHKLDFTEFIKECADAWKPLGAVISVDVTVKSNVPEPNNWYQCYDHESLAQVADYIAVMTYDQHSNHSNAGPVASLDWVETKLQGILEDVPSDKILLGIPFYGRDFPSIISEEDPNILIPTWSTETRGVITIFKIHVDSLLKSNKFVYGSNTEVKVKEWIIKNEWDDIRGVYHLKFIDQNNKVHEIWYEEEESLALKAKLVKKYHLAGLAVWQQSYGRESFWEAVRSEIETPQEIEGTK